MPKPLQGADNWASAARSDPDSARTADTIERVIERRVPTVAPPSPPKRSRVPAPTASLPSSPSQTLVPGSLAYLFAANHTLSGSALKVLLAVLEAGNGAALLRNDFKRMTGLSGDHAVLNAIQECVDNEWLMRQYQCRWCQALLPPTYDSIRLIACEACGRTMTPQAVFCLAMPEECVLNEHTQGMLNEHTRVPLKHTGMLEQHTGVPIQHTGMFIQHTHGMPNEHTPTAPQAINTRMLIGHTGVSKEHTIDGSDERQKAGSGFTAKVNGVIKKHTGGSLQPTAGVSDEHTGMPEKHTSHVRADSDSESVNRISDSRIPAKPDSTETGRVVYGSQGWQEMTERLAKDSAKRIGDKSVGFHVKCWSHARKLDWENGGRRFEDGLLAIAQELERKHSSPGPAQGRSQGALWTKMVRRYFEEKGHPLLTEAQVEEWKELHGTYQPPQL